MWFLTPGGNCFDYNSLQVTPSTSIIETLRLTPLNKLPLQT